MISVRKQITVCELMKNPLPLGAGRVAHLINLTTVCKMRVIND